MLALASILVFLGSGTAPAAVAAPAPAVAPTAVLTPTPTGGPEAAPAATSTPPDEPAAQPAAPVEEMVPRMDYYGTQIVIVNSAAMGMVLIGAVTEAEPLIWGGTAAAFAGTIVLHAAHGNPGRASASFVLRSLLVGVGAAIGKATEDCSSDSSACGLYGTAIGGLVGFGAATIIDAQFLAHHSTWTRRTYYPQVAATAHGLQVGLGGTF